MAATKKYIVIFIILFIVYFVLDYVFNNVMLYIIGGIVGGSISEALELVGISNSAAPAILIWILLLAVLVFLFYRIKSNVLKYLVLTIIAALLYVIDTIFAGIPISDTMDVRRATILGNVLLGVAILLKSLTLTGIVILDKKRAQRRSSAAT